MHQPRTRPPGRRPRRQLTALILTSLVLTACGGSDADVVGHPRPSAAGSAARDTPRDARAVTIPHVYGATVVDVQPERIVSLDTQWTDVLVALGHPPIAATVDANQGDWYPWQTNDGIAKIELSDYTVPIETVATYQPDLIVGSFSVTDRSTYDLLTAIAPTIPLLGERQVDPWEDMATVAGQMLGEPAAAEALIAESDAAVATLAAELAGLAGKSYALANYVPGDQIYVVADANDGASQLFAKLGMRIDPEILALGEGSVGRVEISLERIGELDADLLLMLTNGVEPTDIPGYDALPAVQTGAVSVLDLAPVVGLNTPTPLSIAYSLDVIRPALEAAAAAG